MEYIIRRYRLPQPLSIQEELVVRPTICCTTVVTFGGKLGITQIVTMVVMEAIGNSYHLYIFPNK